MRRMSAAATAAVALALLSTVSAQLQQFGPGCSDEEILTTPSGERTISPFEVTDPGGLDCFFLLQTQPGADADADAGDGADAGIGDSFGLKLTFETLAPEQCSMAGAYLRVYDGGTAFAPVLRTFRCEEGVSIGSSTGTVLLVLHADTGVFSGGFTLTWEPAEGECGNSVCEPSAGEYDGCRGDCEAAISTDDEYRDTKYCRTAFDTIDAIDANGESMQMEYTLAHFGQQLPSTSTSYTLLLATSPASACSTLPPIEADEYDFPTAYLANVFVCHFIEKGIAIEAAGASFGIVQHTDSNLFYMASSIDRRLDARALDIPVVLVNKESGEWLRARLGVGIEVTVVVGGEETRRCSGERLLTQSSGTIVSNPPGTDYCSWQECAWQLSMPSDDVVVLNFSRFDLECVVGLNGPYDYVEVYDGATENAPLLRKLSCKQQELIVSTGRHMLVVFHADRDYNFGGFAADYTSGTAFCAAFDLCSSCSASPACSWCRTSNRCLPAGAADQQCEAESLTLTADTCCDAGFTGAQCDQCAPNFFGPSCRPCSCTFNSVCNDTITGDGSCQCDLVTAFGEPCPCDLRALLLNLRLRAISSTQPTGLCGVGASFTERPALDSALVPPELMLESTDIFLNANFTANVTEALIWLRFQDQTSLANIFGFGSLQQLPLEVGANSLVLTIQQPQRAASCNYTLTLLRPQSNDTSLAAPPSLTAFDMTGAEDASLVGSPRCLAACAYLSCYAVELQQPVYKLGISLRTTHSNLCDISTHACANTTTISISLGDTVFDSGSPKGPRGYLSLVTRPPVGHTKLIVTVKAEDGTVGSHSIALTRSPSSDASLASLSFQGGELGRPFRPTDTTIWVQIPSDVAAPELAPGSRLLVVSAIATHESQCSKLLQPFCSDTPARVEIAGVPSPVSIRVSTSAMTEVITVTAEDGVTTRNYSLTITCATCGSEVPPFEFEDPSGDGSSAPVASVWLLMVLLVATVLLCAISACFCFRIHCMRVAQRGAARAAAPQPARLSGEEVLAALRPFLVEVKPEPGELTDEACAICLGDLTDEDPLNQLPCMHTFHTKCIEGWIVHKGINSTCPLCKRPIDADRQAAISSGSHLYGTELHARPHGPPLEPVPEPSSAEAERVAASVSMEEASVGSGASTSVAATRGGSQASVPPVASPGHGSSSHMVFDAAGNPDELPGDLVAIESKGSIAPPEVSPPSEPPPAGPIPEPVTFTDVTNPKPDTIRSPSPSPTPHFTDIATASEPGGGVDSREQGPPASCKRRGSSGRIAVRRAPPPPPAAHAASASAMADADPAPAADADADAEGDDHSARQAGV